MFVPKWLLFCLAGAAGLAIGWWLHASAGDSRPTARPVASHHAAVAPAAVAAPLAAAQPVIPVYVVVVSQPGSARHRATVTLAQPPPGGHLGAADRGGFSIGSGRHATARAAFRTGNA